MDCTQIAGHLYRLMTKFQSCFGYTLASGLTVLAAALGSFPLIHHFLCHPQLTSSTVPAGWI